MTTTIPQLTVESKDIEKLAYLEWTWANKPFFKNDEFYYGAENTLRELAKNDPGAYELFLIELRGT